MNTNECFYVAQHGCKQDVFEKGVIKKRYHQILSKMVKRKFSLL